MFLTGSRILFFFLITAFYFSCSPFEVQVGAEAGPQKVRAWGPGLREGVVGKSADFVVESIGPEVGSLGKPVQSRMIHNWVVQYFTLN